MILTLLKKIPTEMSTIDNRMERAEDRRNRQYFCLSQTASNFPNRKKIAVVKKEDNLKGTRERAVGKLSILNV